MEPPRKLRKVVDAEERGVALPRGLQELRDTLQSARRHLTSLERQVAQPEVCVSPPLPLLPARLAPSPLAKGQACVLLQRHHAPLPLLLEKENDAGLPRCSPVERAAARSVARIEEFAAAPEREPTMRPNDPERYRPAVPEPTVPSPFLPFRVEFLRGDEADVAALLLRQQCFAWSLLYSTTREKTPVPQGEQLESLVVFLPDVYAADGVALCWEPAHVYWLPLRPTDVAAWQLFRQAMSSSTASKTLFDMKPQLKILMSYRSRSRCTTRRLRIGSCNWAIQKK
eukprot:TRINITY_DN152_c0_g2_i9.p1 TRINITY_DN152_c0_g2~~TRINITY_DN152_c0_g2_i9.p1  ORF type:complete len:284 (-),score=74.54 TRINITY_DN152_c0_g2_i9:289-1140(-)